MKEVIYLANCFIVDSNIISKRLKVELVRSEHQF